MSVRVSPLSRGITISFGLSSRLLVIRVSLRSPIVRLRRRWIMLSCIHRIDDEGGEDCWRYIRGWWFAEIAQMYGVIEG